MVLDRVYFETYQAAYARGDLGEAALALEQWLAHLVPRLQEADARRETSGFVKSPWLDDASLHEALREATQRVAAAMSEVKAEEPLAPYEDDETDTVSLAEERRLKTLEMVFQNGPCEAAFAVKEAAVIEAYLRDGKVPK